MGMISIVNYAAWKRARDAAAALFSADFNGPNSATTPGAAYTVAGGLTFGISSNKLYAVTPASAASGQATHDVGAADVDYTCDIVLRPGVNTDRGCAVVRSDGTVDNKLLVIMDSSTWTTLILSKTVAGTGTTIQTAAFTATIGVAYTVRVVAKGSALEVFIDGVSKITATDAANSTLTYCGAFATRTPTGTSPTFDNLVVRAA